MKARKRRRTVSPDKAARAIMGIYSPLPSPLPMRLCGRCGEPKATIKEPGGLCLPCQVKEKAKTALSGDAEGPF